MTKEKISKIQTEIKKQNLDGLIMGNFNFNISDDLLYYLVLRTPELLLAYIPAQSKPTLWAISFEVAELKKLYPEFTVKPFDRPIENLLSKYVSGKKIGIRSDTLPVLAYRRLKKTKSNLVDFENSEKIVATKFPGEIKRLQKAADITDDIFKKLIKNWKKFNTEAEAANFILTETARHGLKPSFDPIVASGPNAANPHYHPQNKKIQKGFCVIDMGVRYQGYCSDMTRTVYVGKPNKKERELYNKLLEGQEKTLKEVKAGVSTKHLDLFCRDIIGKNLSKEFIHSLGHGVGSQVHEWPSVSERQEVMLKENMIITIEPGVYRQGAYGIRIEDDAVVTKRGCQILNKSPKGLHTV